MASLLKGASGPGRSMAQSESSSGSASSPTIMPSGSSQPTEEESSSSSSSSSSSVFSRRSRKQFSLFLAGSGFVLLSSLITRRATQRRIKWAKPTYFRPNNQHPEQKVDGSLEAIEALSVASVNVFSWGIMLTGGLLWAADISGLAEMRSRLRSGLGVTEGEQKGAQDVVGGWVDAAKPWNALKGAEEQDGGNSDTKPDRTNEGNLP